MMWQRNVAVFSERDIEQQETCLDNVTALKWIDEKQNCGTYEVERQKFKILVDEADAQQDLLAPSHLKRANFKPVPSDFDTHLGNFFKGKNSPDAAQSQRFQAVSDIFDELNWPLMKILPILRILERAKKTRGGSKPRNGPSAADYDLLSKMKVLVKQGTTYTAASLQVAPEGTHSKSSTAKRLQKWWRWKMEKRGQVFASQD